MSCYLEITCRILPQLAHLNVKFTKILDARGRLSHECGVVQRRRQVDHLVAFSVVSSTTRLTHSPQLAQSQRATRDVSKTFPAYHLSSHLTLKAKSSTTVGVFQSSFHISSSLVGCLLDPSTCSALMHTEIDEINKAL